MKSNDVQPESIDEYIARFPKNVQVILQRIRTVIKDAAPDAVEAIKYRMPTFVLHENLVHFAAYSKHIGFYPTPSGIEKFKVELSAYPNAKGSVQFPLDQDVPYELIKRIVIFRAMEAKQKASDKSKKAKKRS